jgi:hypothetical protein
MFECKNSMTTAEGGIFIPLDKHIRRPVPLMHVTEITFV